MCVQDEFQMSVGCLLIFGCLFEQDWNEEFEEKEMINVSVTDRFTMDQVVHHAYFESYRKQDLFVSTLFLSLPWTKILIQ